MALNTRILHIITASCAHWMQELVIEAKTKFYTEAYTAFRSLKTSVISSVVQEQNMFLYFIYMFLYFICKDTSCIRSGVHLIYSFPCIFANFTEPHGIWKQRFWLWLLQREHICVTEGSGTDKIHWIQVHKVKQPEDLSYLWWHKEC